MANPKREIAVTTKTLDAKRGVVRYLASDATIDSYGELIDPAGWMFDERWDANPAVPNSHQYGDVRDMLGKGVHREVSDKGLIIDVEYAVNVPGHEDAVFVFEMVNQGFLPGCSVGFRPVEYAYAWGNPEAWSKAVAYVSQKFSLQPAQIARLDGIYLKQQLTELSPCVLGANPNALAQIAKAYGSKTLSEKDFARLLPFVGHETEKLSAPVQPSSESDPSPTVGNGGAVFACPADVALVRAFENAAAGTGTTRDVLKAFERLAA